ncbi:CBS domain-containing protein [Gracilibacillus xinjiangensis]|uniref:CBS domain-containing protein n=1 Tax=Gracilibacillus xinjiangensis TaxID=1193282 RepID=A0ABV8X1Y6_9BACI
MVKKNNELSERFEAAFNQIHDQLCQYAHEVNNHISFTEVLEKAKPHHKIIQAHFGLLKQCNKLRNAMIHRKIKQKFYIAEPHVEVVEELEQIASTLSRPPLAINYASKPVEFFKEEASISEVLKVITSKHFSQFPIYRQDKCIGLLTEGAILHWLATRFLYDSSSIDQCLIQDVFSFETEANIAFLSENATIFDAQAIFQHYMNQNRKLEAIVITKTGDEQTVPLGIISSWDLIRLELRTYPLLNHT